MNVIIVHGRPGKDEYYSADYPSSSNFAWIPWLQKQLIINDIKADTPEMMHAYAPDWSVWKTELERFDVTPETVLVGHSNGAGFLVRWLSENREVKVNKVILVAPSFYEGDFTDGEFFDFEIDPLMGERLNQITIFNGLKDSIKVHESVNKILTTLPITKVLEFPEKGHFVIADGTLELPELLKEILS